MTGKNSPTRDKKPSFAAEFRHLRAFVALVETGSITEAAQMLGLAQSTVSESLTALERALGTPMTLPRRGARDVLLTAAGHTLLPHARSLLAALDEAQVAVASVTNSAHASVRIITNESISTYLLPKTLAILRGRWPHTSFAVTVGTCDESRAGVANGEFDIGLLFEVDAPANKISKAERMPPNVAGLSAERVIVSNSLGLVIFASPAHPIISPSVKPIPAGELAEYAIFMSDSAGAFHAAVRAYLEADGVRSPHLESSGSVEGVKRAVAADARAFGILPAYAIAEELQTGQFAVLSLRPSPPRMRLEALLSNHRARHPSVSELIDNIRAGRLSTIG
jgi:DNA-binding transcriptional LysR family regulator